MNATSKIQPAPPGAKPANPPARPVKSTALPWKRKGNQAVPASRDWAWHRDALLVMRERILGRQEGVRKDSKEPMQQHGMDLADSATDEFDLEMSLSVASSQQDILYEIDEALAPDPKWNVRSV